MRFLTELKLLQKAYALLSSLFRQAPDEEFSSEDLKDGWNLLSDVKEATFANGVDEREKKERPDWCVSGVFEKERQKKWKRAKDAKRKAVALQERSKQREGKIVMTLATAASASAFVLALVLVSEVDKADTAADTAGGMWSLPCPYFPYPPCFSLADS
ncbi:uncharacterized protein MONOS_16546 [Monocercomonoides exilis]|uniref:uncharacterized protein n=1 Tax=Monocercomonoides exilis TaxID=2049356 RepID=UPI00355A1205|nr:hypothetical protein MONOS_16546 [Monocercomonoides exilis]|eukprot:MONOS_16546.1-p1 / transcript=MONOS_16546.1 / gene=MONOS_16546 / organism=Monocercomonoides_exilis_PA203 / gene_product=unspecified product / transcript_product=unspecified product / location=Mono_scaffold01852:1064-1969(+) / protein_length=158 / sequence_SO=supercontig / SO=protein_coding / is_pseudo=false